MPFPPSVRALPRTSLGGADVYVHQAGTTQILFIEVPMGRSPVEVPTHTHDVEWGVVVEGRIDMTFPDRTEHHGPGDTHLIPRGVPHSFRFQPGTASIHYFVELRVNLPADPPR